MSDKPWEHEPDEVDFEAHGLPCVMRRGPGGHWCGYVGIGPEHPAFGRLYDDIDVEVHGGLTYGRDAVPGQRPDGRWWYGFDCAHYDDLSPGYAWGHHELGQVYRDEGYVRAECMSLAQQLAALMGGGDGGQG